MPCAEDWAACRSLPTPYQCILNSLGSTDSSTHSKTACQAHRTYPLGRRRITVHECFCYLGQSDAVAKHLPLLGPSTGSSTEANQHKSYIRFREFRSFFPCVCVCVLLSVCADMSHADCPRVFEMHSKVWKPCNDTSDNTSGTQYSPTVPSSNSSRGQLRCFVSRHEPRPGPRSSDSGSGWGYKHLQTLQNKKLFNSLGSLQHSGSYLTAAFFFSASNQTSLSV